MEISSPKKLNKTLIKLFHAPFYPLNKTFLSS